MPERKQRAEVDLGLLAFADSTIHNRNQTRADIQRADATNDVHLAARAALPGYGFLTADADARAILGAAVLDRFRQLVEIGAEDLAYHLDTYHECVDAL